MSQWQDPIADPAIAALSVNTIYLLLGLYGWEYIQSLGVEYAVIRGRLSVRWPLIPYVVGRASLFVFLIMLAIGTSPFLGDTPCQPSIVATSLSGNIALGCSSTIFVIRTWLIWKDSRWVHVLLSLLLLGQWILLAFDATTIKTIVVNGICEVYLDYPQMSGVILVYMSPVIAFKVALCSVAMSYDLLVFVLSIVGLSRQRSESPLKKRLRAQGIVYLALATIAYIPTVVTALINSASVMTIFSNFAITVSTIASSRAVRSLLFLDTTTGKPGQTLESNIALTTQIMIHPLPVICEDAIPGERRHVDETDRG